MEKITLTRSQLYDLVWSKPTSALAKEYGISDNSLRTTCKKFNIPLPYAGYWAIIKHGKPARKVKLPTVFEGKDEIVINPPNEKLEVKQSEVSAITTLIKEIESNHKQFLEVPSRLNNPDELVVKAKDALTIKKEYWTENGLIETKSGIIKIKVAQDNVPRALRFMDALIKLLKARGHNIKFGSEGSYVEVFDVQFVIRLQEKLRIEDVKEGSSHWNTRYYYPTELFMLRVWKDYHWHQKVWIDGKIPIENQLAKIVAGIELMARKELQERLEREERRKIIEENQRIEKEKQRLEKERFDREELDGANFKKLLAQSHLWKQSMILTEYIDAIGNKANLAGGITDELQDWLKWAREKAARFNPINDL